MTVAARRVSVMEVEPGSVLVVAEGFRHKTSELVSRMRLNGGALNDEELLDLARQQIGLMFDTMPECALEPKDRYHAFVQTDAGWESLITNGNVSNGSKRHKEPCRRPNFRPLGQFRH